MFRIRYGDESPYAIAAAIKVAVDRRNAGDLEGAGNLGREIVDR
jgi:hypothetical protein